MNTTTIYAGEIGPVRRQVEFEPMPTTVPVEEPAYAPIKVPTEPVKVPA